MRPHGLLCCPSARFPSVASDQFRHGWSARSGRRCHHASPRLAGGLWCGRVLPADGPVLIGMDSRCSGSMVVAALTAGLTAAGRDVWTLGLCPTPAVPGLIRRFQAAGGLMVSASHNPRKTTASRCSALTGASLALTCKAGLSPACEGTWRPLRRWVPAVLPTIAPSCWSITATAC